MFAPCHAARLLSHLSAVNKAIEQPSVILTHTTILTSGNFWLVPFYQGWILRFFVREKPESCYIFIIVWLYEWCLVLNRLVTRSDWILPAILFLATAITISNQLNNAATYCHIHEWSRGVSVQDIHLKQENWNVEIKTKIYTIFNLRMKWKNEIIISETYVKQGNWELRLQEI